MESEFVTLEQAKRLAALGFPQKEWPCCIWWPTFPDTPEDAWRYDIIWDNRAWSHVDPTAHYAAPTYLRAFIWLREQHNLCVSCTPLTDGRVLWQSWRCAVREHPLESATPSGLLDAILSRLEV